METDFMIVTFIALLEKKRKKKYIKKRLGSDIKCNAFSCMNLLNANIPAALVEMIYMPYNFTAVLQKKNSRKKKGKTFSNEGLLARIKFNRHVSSHFPPNG